MSRGFVKEDDQEEAPFIPPRAALPPGVTNYVTPAGLQQLLDEKKRFEEARAELQAENETERRRAQAVFDGKINLLNERIKSARVLYPEEQPEDVVRFGAKINLKILEKNIKQEFQIVGVDEADVRKNKIAFVAPIARSVTGKRVGDVIDFKMGNDLRRLQILSINYDNN